jgi:ketosteroid isomerase-like protein
MCLHFPEARDARDARDAASGTEEAEAMARTPQDIFAAHASALAAGDIGRILEDYSDDAVLLTADGTFRGRNAIGEFCTAALGALPEAYFTMGAAVFEGDALLLLWSATSPKGKITDAVDTLVFADGRIRLQTTVFHVEPA